MDSIEIIRKGEITAHIVYDDHPQSPREWSNLAHLVGFEGTPGDETVRVTYGDERRWHLLNLLAQKDDRAHETLYRAYERGRDIDALLMGRVRRFYAILPYYDHNRDGSLYCGAHDDRINAVNGWAYIDLAKAREEWPDDSHNDLLARAEDCIRGEITDFSQYIAGTVYGVVVEDENGAIHDSCFGFYGEIEHVIPEAKWMLDHAHDDRLKHSVIDPLNMAPLTPRGVSSL